jgi:hypothetical protein
MTAQEQTGYKLAIDDLCELFDRRYDAFRASCQTGENVDSYGDELYTINECICALQVKLDTACKEARYVGE